MEKRKSELCLKCLRCCEVIKLVFEKPPSQTMMEFYKVRGCKVGYEKETGYFFLSIPCKCPQLTLNGCAIYENRPQACRDYDGRLDSTVDCMWKELDEKGE